MRVTNGMIQNSMMNNLYRNMGQLDKTYNQMNTLKKAQRPSDDPIVVGRSLKLRINVLQTEQHKKNVDEAKAWMDITETALTNIQGIMKDIRTRCVQASTGTLTDEDREKIETEILELQKQIVQEANGTYSGRYIFSGFKTDKPMFIEDPQTGEMILNPEVNGLIDGQGIDYEIGVGNTIQINTLGMDQLMEEFGIDIQAMVDSLNDPNANQNEFFTNMIEEMDEHLSNISEMISDLGSKKNRLDYTETRLVDDKTNMTELLSETENVDLEEVYVKFNTEYMVYQSALQATSKMISHTLADFLR